MPRWGVQKTADNKNMASFCEYEKLAFINGLFEMHEL